MRISDWSSDVCSSDLRCLLESLHRRHQAFRLAVPDPELHAWLAARDGLRVLRVERGDGLVDVALNQVGEIPFLAFLHLVRVLAACREARSEEHTSELQSLMRISYAVFCLKKKQTPR